MTERIGFVCESSADFPPGMTKDLNIHTLPVHVVVDKKDHIHGISIDNNQVLSCLKKNQAVETKPFYPAECADFFENLLERYDRIVSFHISAHLSDNYQSACAALNLMSQKDATRVTIIDLGSVSLSLGQVAVKAMQLLARDGDLATLEQRLTPIIKDTFMGFTVDNLKWLKKGGRVSSLAAFIGGIFDIKPIINLQAARLVPTEKHRGKKAALKRLVSLAVDKARSLQGQCDIWLGYAGNLTEAVVTREKLAADLNCNVDTIKMVPVGATIAAHIGPGSICIAVSPGIS